MPEPLPEAPLSTTPVPGSKRGKAEGRPGLWVILAAWGPCGFLPGAPGTWGTIGAIPLFWVLRDLEFGTYLLTTLAFTALAVYAAAHAGRYWGVTDASQIVIDEVAGYLVTMALAPGSIWAALAGFVLFRLFDVLKPWPANLFDRMKNPFGVVLDDVFAGLWSLAALEVLRVALRLFAGCSNAHWWCWELTP